MPPPLNSQTVVAFVWDFDKTLTPGYMQEPIFAEYGVDAREFWREVNSLVSHYEARGLKVSKDSAYLGHMISYAQGGPFDGLTNQKLREFGAQVPLAPGMPDFMIRTKAAIAASERFVHHGISVEHYIVSTGLRQMIEGNSIREHVDGIWACELLADPPGAGYLTDATSDPLTSSLSQVGYVIDNTTKTRAIFEINKGVNVEPTLDVNARMSQDDRRVPISNMIYIADGPSDVPVFSVVNMAGGKTLGVYTGGATGNYDGVRQLSDDGRVHMMAEANYVEGSPADLWLMSSMRKIAEGICDSRDRGIAGITGPAGHKV